MIRVPCLLPGPDDAFIFTDILLFLLSVVFLFYRIFIQIYSRYLVGISGGI